MFAVFMVRNRAENLFKCHYRGVSVGRIQNCARFLGRTKEEEWLLSRMRTFAKVKDLENICFAELLQNIHTNPLTRPANTKGGDRENMPSSVLQVGARYS
jgi:hypothetical protein